MNYQVTILLDPNLLARIDEEARRERKSRSQYIRQACEKALTLERGISNAIRKRQLNE